MSVSSAQLTAQIQLPLDKIPFYRSRSRESDFAERLSADLVSVIILDQLERQQILSKAPIILSAVRLDMPNDVSPYVAPTAAPSLIYNCHDGAATRRASLTRPQPDFQLFDSPHLANTPNNLDSSMSPPMSGSDEQATQSMDVDNDSMSGLSTAQIPTRDLVEGLNQDTSDALPPRDSSVGVISGSNESEDGHNKSPNNTAYDDHLLVAEASLGTTGLAQALSYPTPDSHSPNTPNTPIPASKRVKRSAKVTPGGNFPPSPLQTPRPGNFSDDRTPSNCESEQSLSNLQPTVEDAPDHTKHDDPDGDGFGDLEVQSFLDETHKLQDTSPTPEASVEHPARTSESSFQNSDGTPQDQFDPAAESPRRDSISSNPPSLSDALSESHEDVGKFDGDYGRSRKRKRDVVSVEELDGSTPKSAASYPSSLAEEDEKDLNSQGHFSQPDTSLSSPSSHSSTEEMDDSETHELDLLGSILSRLSVQQVAEVQRTGDHLLLCNLGTFLEKHSGTWKASGFWNAPSWNTSESSDVDPRPTRAFLMTYLAGLHNANDIHDVKLRIARVSLFLFFEREIKCERHRGTAETVLKRNAVSTLCNSRGLGPVERRKLHKSFHNEKKIGEYWWWAVYFFGPSFLLRCGKEAGKKINNSRFPLDAMIAYVLHRNPLAVKPYPALDDAVVHLLITGKFHGEFARQDVQMWEQSTDTGSTSSRAWRPFSTEAVAEDALANLNKWATNPENRLLTF